jgi:hypothetical protein
MNYKRRYINKRGKYRRLVLGGWNRRKHKRDLLYYGMEKIGVPPSVVRRGDMEERDSSA